MAEEEIAKHTKKIYKFWTSKEHSLWHKIKEFLIEIFIIVFSITVSIWLHDKSEHNQQQKEVKEFLLGLREDLLSDLNEMNGDKASYVSQGKLFNYITSAKPHGSLSFDTLYKYRKFLYNTTRLQQNDGRFEGFKASGKIGFIEDEKLQNDIMDLYQENIPSLLASTDGYLHWKNELFEYGVKNRKVITDSSTNITTILLTNEAQNLCGFLANPVEILNRYDVCINKMKTIVAEIDNKYKIEK